jgi:hypothetical protein
LREQEKEACFGKSAFFVRACALFFFVILGFYHLQQQKKPPHLPLLFLFNYSPKSREAHMGGMAWQLVCGPNISPSTST